MVVTAESTMGITVFFEETLSDAEIQDIGARIQHEKSCVIKDLKFVSAEEAWKEFQSEYFGENTALAAGFAEDNPLAGSSSYEIYLYEIAEQGPMVEYLQNMTGVRKVNYSNSAVAGLSSFNKILTLLCGVILTMLLAVAVS